MILFALDSLVDLFAVDRDVLRGIDANAHLIALHAKYGERDLVADHHRFADTPRQNQHAGAPKSSFTVTAAHLTAFRPLRRRALRDVERSRESPREFVNTLSIQ